MRPSDTDGSENLVGASATSIRGRARVPEDCGGASGIEDQGGAGETKEPGGAIRMMVPCGAEGGAKMEPTG